MSVEITIELEELPEIEVTLGILYFIGIADHSQMKNRDADNQHPIAAINGLVERLQGFDADIETARTALGEVEQIVEQYGTTLDEQGSQLSEQAGAVEKLLAFSENIATADIVEEVLRNG